MLWCHNIIVFILCLADPAEGATTFKTDESKIPPVLLFLPRSVSGKGRCKVIKTGNCIYCCSTGCVEEVL